MNKVSVFKCLFFLGIFFALPACGSNMFSSQEDVFFFSKVEGVLLMQGKPAAGAKVLRKYTYGADEPVIDSAVADGQGRFTLPAAVRRGVAVSGLVQFVVYQEMSVSYEGKNFEIWLHGKMEKSENSEYGGDFKKISCELTVSPERKEVGLLNVHYTNCEW